MLPDRARSTAVAVTALTQVLSAPLTLLLLGPSSQTAQISDANQTPVTPAGYAFSIWGLIYAASIALAIYQLLPTQQDRPVHRRTGWWLAAAFAASTVWVPIFGTGVLWLAQVDILLLVLFLAVAAARFTSLGAASTRVEQALLRVPVTLYLGWATLASAAGFGAMFRSFGMPATAGWVSGISLALVIAAAVASVLVVSRFDAVAGFTFSSCWALVAVAVATDVTAVRAAALAALVLVLIVLLRRTARSRAPRTVLLG